MKVRSVVLCSAIVMLLYTIVLIVGSFFSFSLTAKDTFWSNTLHFLSHFPINWGRLIDTSLLFILLNGLFWGIIVYFIYIGCRIILVKLNKR